MGVDLVPIDRRLDWSAHVDECERVWNGRRARVRRSEWCHFLCIPGGGRVRARERGHAKQSELFSQYPFIPCHHPIPVPHTPVCLPVGRSSSRLEPSKVTSTRQPASHSFIRTFPRLRLRYFALLVCAGGARGPVGYYTIKWTDIPYGDGWVYGHGMERYSPHLTSPDLIRPRPARRVFFRLSLMRVWGLGRLGVRLLWMEGLMRCVCLYLDIHTSLYLSIPALWRVWACWCSVSRSETNKTIWEGPLVDRQQMGGFVKSVHVQPRP
mmetsp:Transcript_14814/g.35308  ORF Transcript_14814/g.35308 Transcript_14814/m.35308 type:complete len:267 (-) Transcript_14814:907-1707(-)